MSEQDIDAKLSRRPIERYQWPLSAALILLAASSLIGERRRGAPGLRAALLFVLLPLAAQAVNPGVEHYQRHQYPEALNEFSTQLKRQPESPALQFDRGTAAYKAGDLDQALGGIQPGGHFNRSAPAHEGVIQHGQYFVPARGRPEREGAENPGVEECPPALRGGVEGGAQECGCDL